MTGAAVHIGTSGWHYRHWLGPFYPEGMGPSSFLDFYCRHFRTVEINNSFYRLPEEDTMKAWQRQTQEGFIFSIKASRYLTHMKKLKDPAEPLEIFLGRASLLCEKLGPVLFQLPPRWRCNIERLRKFLALLPADSRSAFEFRDQSWFRPEVYDALRKAGAAFCIYDLAGRLSPREVTADFVYIRLHGPGAAYSGRYDTAALANWAGAIASWQDRGKEVFCYFDNDQGGFAVANALELIKLLQG